MKSLSPVQLMIVKAIRDASYTIKNVSLFAVSGDDIYVVIDGQDGEWTYLKLLYGNDGDDMTHDVHDRQTFDTRGKACVYLSQQLLEEEEGYAEADV